jgi:hypothetical protein
VGSAREYGPSLETPESMGRPCLIFHLSALLARPKIPNPPQPLSTPHGADGFRRRGGGCGDPGGAGRWATEGKPRAFGGRGHEGDGENGRMERHLLQGRQRRRRPPRRQPRHLLAVSATTH